MSDCLMAGRRLTSSRQPLPAPERSAHDALCRLEGIALSPDTNLCHAPYMMKISKRSRQTWST